MLSVDSLEVGTEELRLALAKACGSGDDVRGTARHRVGPDSCFDYAIVELRQRNIAWPEQPPISGIESRDIRPCKEYGFETPNWCHWVLGNQLDLVV